MDIVLKSIIRVAASAQRIWAHRQSDWEARGKDRLRHFIVTLKEATFECIGSLLVIERFCKTFEEAYAHVIGKLKEH